MGTIGDHEHRAIFVAAAFEPAKRRDLVRQLQMDPALRAAAQHELARLNEGQKLGMLLDRCHISRTTHATLTAALAQAGAQEMGVSVHE